MKTVGGARRGDRSDSAEPLSSSFHLSVDSLQGRNGQQRLRRRLTVQRVFVKALAGFVAFQLAVILWGYSA